MSAVLLIWTFDCEQMVMLYTGVPADLLEKLMVPGIDMDDDAVMELTGNTEEVNPNTYNGVEVKNGRGIPNCTVIMPYSSC